MTTLGQVKKTTNTIFTCSLEIIQYALKGQKFLGGCVKTPNINKKNSLYVLVWMYNEFLFFYKKEPYKQFIWRYIGQISPQIREKSSLGHFCHHFLYIKGNGKEGKVHFDLVYTDMAKTTIRHVVFNLSENRFRLNTSFASMP